MIKQKLAGAILIAISGISLVVFKDGAYAITFIPIGFCTLFTKESVMTDSENNISLEDFKR